MRGSKNILRPSRASFLFRRISWTSTERRAKSVRAVAPKSGHSVDVVNLTVDAVREGNGAGQFTIGRKGRGKSGGGPGNPQETLLGKVLRMWSSFDRGALLWRIEGRIYRE